jgi:hypothetical protein
LLTVYLSHSIMAEIVGIGNMEMPAIIHDKDILIPVNIVFDFLKIKNTMSPSFDSLSGFYVNQKDAFLIDRPNNRITYRDTVTNLKPGDLVKANNNLYINLKYFKPIFNIEGSFNFRRLLVTLTSGIELPAQREAKQELMRRNINRLKGDIKADTVINRTYPAFHFGMADWAIMSSQQSIGLDETRLNLGLGAVLAGGEANASLNYSTLSKWDEKQQFYQWRYVNNDNAAVRQILAGKIFAQSIATLYAPVVGVQITNAPTTYRKSYGTYTISNTTDPNWIVELYVNGVLIDYKKADAAGFYTFEVPLIYGYSIIKLRFYGPYGEERITQTYINVPFNFLPVREFEYTASAGIVEDGSRSVYSRIGVNYGLSRAITIGGGTEYLSSITTGATIPFLNASIKLAKQLLLSGEYDYGVSGRSTLSYRLPSSLQIDLDYIKYSAGQTAIYFNYLEERKASVSMPLNSGMMALFTRFTLDQITVPNANYTNLEWTFTGAIKNVGLNFSNYASIVKATSPYFYGLLSLSFLLPAKISLNTQLQYDYKAQQPQFTKISFEKHLLGKGYLNLSYQQFFSANSEAYTGNYYNILIGLRYDFSFMRVALSSLSDNHGGSSRVQTASGSFIYDQKSHYANANNRTNVGRGGITIAPYLDINCNGKWDDGEPRVQGLKLHINGGRIIADEKDTVIRILDLEPYVSYYLELNKTSFDNIAWQIKNGIIKVTVTPNDLTLIEVPVAVVGEVSGIVSLSDKNGKILKGGRQIIVNIYNKDSVIFARTMTESDGFFSYTGLAPGSYTLQIDTGQLDKLHMKPVKAVVSILIKQNIEGDIVDGVVFVLQPFEDEVPTQADDHTREGTNDSLQQPQGGKDSGLVQKPTGVTDQQTASGDSIILAAKGTFSIQVCAVKDERNAKRIQADLIKKLKLPVAIVHRDKFYKPRIIGFAKNKDVRKMLPQLAKKGVKGFLVVKLLYPIYK